MALVGGIFTGFLCAAHTCLICAGISTRSFWLKHYRPGACYARISSCGPLAITGCCVLLCIPCLPAKGFVRAAQNELEGRPNKLSARLSF